MDVVQVVEAAVVGGAAAGMKTQATAVVNEVLEQARTSLRAVAQRLFGVGSVAETALEKLPQAPKAQVEGWRAVLAAQVAQLSPEQTAELVAAAQEVLAVTDPEGTGRGAYSLTAEQIGVAVAGDVRISADHQGVAGWDVRIGGVAPVDPPVPGRSPGH